MQTHLVNQSINQSINPSIKQSIFFCTLTRKLLQLYNEDISSLLAVGRSVLVHCQRGVELEGFLVFLWG